MTTKRAETYLELKNCYLTVFPEEETALCWGDPSIDKPEDLVREILLDMRTVRDSATVQDAIAFLKEGGYGIFDPSLREPDPEAVVERLYRLLRGE